MYRTNIDTLSAYSGTPAEAFTINGAEIRDTFETINDKLRHNKLRHDKLQYLGLKI